MEKRKNPSRSLPVMKQGEGRTICFSFESDDDDHEMP